MKPSIQLKSYSLIMKEDIFNSIRLYWDKPSVTSVLKILKDSDSFEQFKQSDLKWFKDMLKRKWEAGTKLHKCIEDTYSKWRLVIPDTEHKDAWIKFYTKEWYAWKLIHNELEVKDNRIAWCLDAIMNINWVSYIIDWKTYWQRTYDELLFKYKLQLSKYAHMYNHLYWHGVTQGKLVMFNNKGNYTILTVEDLDYYYQLYEEIADEFFKMYNQYKDVKENTITASWIQEIDL